ncbi:MAG: FliM/FliN family flagellar motor switch protein [Pirellulales bacterium]|nr:FliM/FliN family flagellar motor switch protein [Pirellulales bacterium]
MIEDADQSLDLVDQVEAPVHFSLGDLSVPLTQLQSAQPGFIFELDAPPTNPVAISVNGALIGRGEPVLVDGRLAIRLTEVIQDGN